MIMGSHTKVKMERPSLIQSFKSLLVGRQPSASECKREGESQVRCLLTRAPCRKLLRIVGVLAENGSRKRLADLGLVETALLSVASCSELGLILRLSGGSRLAIDRALAEAVLVESL